MVGEHRAKSITTRVSKEAYAQILRKCADLECSPYDYVRALVNQDLEIPTETPAESLSPPAKGQIELNEKNESDERRFDFRS